jgi:hypothetical protein
MMNILPNEVCFPGKIQQESAKRWPQAKHSVR